MQNIKLILEYDGGGFSGWQKQSGTSMRTVQGVLDAALKQLTGTAHVTAGAGRTDAGVHALGQVAHFATESRFPVDRWPVALNGVLPPDVSVRSAEAVEDSFHARRSAKGKEYCYLILNCPLRSAVWYRYSCHIAQRLDVERMARGAVKFIGAHDFRAFSAVGSSTRGTIRQVFNSSVFACDEWIGFRVAANGFLYKMVRLMAGMLVDIGLGKADPDQVESLLESGERGMGGRTLPPQGLFMVRVVYNDESELLETSEFSPAMRLFGRSLARASE